MANKALGFIYQISMDRPFAVTLSTFYITIVRLVMEHACIVWYLFLLGDKKVKR